MTNTIENRPSEAEDPSWIEWATGLVSALLVIVVIGWIAWEALTDEDKPPEFAISVTGRQAVQGGYRVTFDISNAASRTASAVVVRGEILEGGKAVEEAEVTFDYVPAQAKVKGAIFFSHDPGPDEV